MSEDIVQVAVVGPGTKTLEDSSDEYQGRARLALDRRREDQLEE